MLSRFVQAANPEETHAVKLLAHVISRRILDAQGLPGTIGRPWLPKVVSALLIGRSIF